MEEEGAGDVPFREVVGSLMWIASQTRVDISNAVRAVARRSHEPKKSHWKAAQKILNYLLEMAHLAVKFKRDSSVDVRTLVYVDLTSQVAVAVATVDVAMLFVVTGRVYTTHRSFGYGWQGGSGRPHRQTGLGRRRRRRRRRRQRYRFEGHCGDCGHWGHMERDCIPDRSFSNDFKQPHADVVTPGYPFNGFGGGGSASWKDPRGDEIPWQGEQLEGTPPGSVGMTAYGGAYAAVPPQRPAGALADSSTYCTACIPQPSPPSIQRQQQQQQQKQKQQQHQDFGSAGEHATVGGAAG
eukprot:g6671.t1